MGQILVISDNDILNQLYVTNLEVYLGVKVVVVDSTQKAFLHLKNSRPDLLITMNMINGNNSALESYEHLVKNQYKTKLVVIGNPGKVLADVAVVPNSYNLQILIRSCANILGITAKQMAEKEMPRYYEVENKFLAKIREAPCPVYLQMKNDEFILVAKKGDVLIEIIKKFSKEGIEKLYVNSLDRLIVINTISISIVDYLKNTEGLETTQKSEALKVGFDFVASTFSTSTEVTAEIVLLANSCTKVMEEIVHDTPSLKKLLAILNTHRDGFVYTHSIFAAYVSNHLIRRVSWGGDSHLEKVNFVLFFHDIMLAPIYAKHPGLKYEEDLLFSDELTDQEKEVVLNHARLAAEMIIGYKRAPIGADLLIKQHHGMTNGVGFALDYKDDISPLSKIVLVAEAFIEEFMKLRDSNPNYVLDTKIIMNALNEKFKKPTYKKIIETLVDFPGH